MLSAHPSTMRDAALLALTATAVATGSAHAAAPDYSVPTDNKPGIQLRASLKYVDGSKGEVPAWRDIRVSVVREGKTLATDQLLPAGANASYFLAPKLTAVDLNDDAEPEVLVDVFTATPQRERRTVVLYRKRNAYATSVTDWGTAGYRLGNVVGKKSPEFLTSDSRVSRIYGSTARGPLRVLAYRGGKLRDVSRSAKRALLGDAKRHRRALAKARRTGADTRSEVAAYALDLVRLGRTSTAQAEIRTAGRRKELKISARSFARQLDRGMVRWGYAKRKVLARGL